MKVAFVLVDNLPFPAVKGGAIESLLTLFANQNEKEKKIDMYVYSIADDEAKKVLYNNTIVKYTKKGGKNQERLNFILRKLSHFGINIIYNSYYKQVYRDCKKEKYDIIVIEGGSIERQRYLKFRRTGICCYHLHYNGYPATNKKIYDYIIGVSDFVLNEWKSKSPMQKMITVRNGIDISLFQRKNTKCIREKLGFSDDDFVVLYVGRIIKEKGIYELLCAIEKITNHSIKLLVIGSSNFAIDSISDYEKNVKRKVGTLGEKVVFTGYIPNKDLNEYYKAADIQVVPSLWEEAAGLVAIEGLASGLPIIATRSGGMTEYIDDKCALIVEKDENVVDNLANGIMKLYGDKELRKQMSEEGLKRCELFSGKIFYNNMVEALESIYKSVKGI